MEECVCVCRLKVHFCSQSPRPVLPVEEYGPRVRIFMNLGQEVKLRLARWILSSEVSVLLRRDDPFDLQGVKNFPDLYLCVQEDRNG